MQGVNDVLTAAQSCSSEYTVSVTYLELYNEELIDLLVWFAAGKGGSERTFLGRLLLQHPRRPQTMALGWPTRAYR